LIGERGEKLVFGDFLLVFDVKPVGQTVRDIFQEAEKLNKTMNKILTVFVSFVVAKGGFDYLNFLQDRKNPLMTTKFRRQDWVQKFEHFEPLSESGRVYYWICDYEAKSGGNVHIILTSEQSVYTYRLTTEEAVPSPPIALKEFMPNATNLIIVDPRVSSVNRENFIKNKRMLSENLGQDVLLTTDELIHRFVPDDRAKDQIKREWIEIRNDTISNLLNQSQWLVPSLYSQKLSEIEESLSEAEARIKEGKPNYAIYEVGLGCESLLTIIYHTVKGMKPVGLSFNDMLSETREWILDKLGEDILKDLEFIRQWRNKADHPSEIRPTVQDAVKVIYRGRLIYKTYCLSAGYSIK
jgi:hypothetical protein